MAFRGEVFRTLRRRDAFGRALPALMISGTMNISLVEQPAPGIPVAIKPVSPGKLRAFLSRVAQRDAGAAEHVRTA